MMDDASGESCRTGTIVFFCLGYSLCHTFEFIILINKLQYLSCKRLYSNGDTDEIIGKGGRSIMFSIVSVSDPGILPRS